VSRITGANSEGALEHFSSPSLISNW